MRCCQRKNKVIKRMAAWALTFALLFTNSTLTVLAEDELNTLKEKENTYTENGFLPEEASIAAEDVEIGAAEVSVDRTQETLDEAVVEEYVNESNNMTTEAAEGSQQMSLLNEEKETDWDLGIESEAQNETETKRSYTYEQPLSEPGDRRILVNGYRCVDAFIWCEYDEPDEIEGDGFFADVTSVTVTKSQIWDEQKNTWADTQDKIVSIKRNFLDGWDIIGKKCGRAFLFVQFEDEYGNQIEINDIELYVYDEVYTMSYTCSQNLEQMLVRQSAVINNISIEHEFINQQGKPDEEPLTGFTISVVNDDRTPCYDPEYMDAKVEYIAADPVGYRVRITTKNKTGSTSLRLRGMLDGKECCTIDIPIRITNEYYTLQPETSLPGDVEEDDVLDLTTQSWKLQNCWTDENGKFCSETVGPIDGNAYRILLLPDGYEEEMWDIVKGTEDDLIPLLQRAESEPTEIRVTAQKKSVGENAGDVWLDIAEYVFLLSNNKYDVSLAPVDEKFEGMTLFTGANDILTLRLTQEDEASCQLPKGYTVNWTVTCYGGKEVETDEWEDTEIDCIKYRCSADGSTITIQSINKTIVSNYAYCYAVIEAFVYLGDEEIASTYKFLNIENPTYTYVSPFDEADNLSIVPDQEVTIAPEMECYVRDANHAGDDEVETISVKDVKILSQYTLDEQGKEKEIKHRKIADVRKDGHGNWILRGLSPGGFIKLQLTYADVYPNKGEHNAVYRIAVAGEMYRLQTDQVKLLPDTSADIATMVDHVRADSTVAWYCEDVKEYQLKIGEDGNGNPAYDTDSLSASVIDDKTIHIETKENETMAEIGLEIYIAGKLAAEEILTVNICNPYETYGIDPIYVQPGETLDIDNVRISHKDFSVEHPEGMEVLLTDLKFEASEYGTEYSVDTTCSSITFAGDLSTGYKIYVPIRIDESNDEEKYIYLPVIICNHELDGGVIVTAPACTSPGVRIRTCTLCQTKKTEYVEATGHQMIYHEAAAATCTSHGHTAYYSCINCGNTFSDSDGNSILSDIVTPITETHSFTDWRIVIAPTALTKGVQTRTCTRCGHSQQLNIDNLTASGSLSLKDFPLKVKQSFTLRINGMAAGDRVISWKSSNTRIAAVNNAGKVTAMKKGSTKITATLASGLKLTTTVKVQTSTVKTTKITVNARNVTLKTRQGFQILAARNPATSQQGITYSTSNKKIATVSRKGYIKGVKAGTATITVKSGSKSVKIKVKVEGVKTTSLIANRTAVTLKKNKTFAWKVKTVPANSSEKITYTTSNKKVATVSTAGKIKAKKKGTATITAKSGNKRITIKVTVN